MTKKNFKNFIFIALAVTSCGLFAFATVDFMQNTNVQQVPIAITAYNG